MGELDDSFEKLLGRQSTDADRQNLYRVRDALGLKNNDALWLIVMALQYYLSEYEKIPGAIAQTAKDTLTNFRATADATLEARADSTQASELQETIRQLLQELAALPDAIANQVSPVLDAYVNLRKDLGDFQPAICATLKETMNVVNAAEKAIISLNRDASITDEDTILGLIAAAEEQQTAAKTAVEGIAAERAALARAVQEIQEAARALITLLESSSR